MVGGQLSPRISDVLLGQRRADQLPGIPRAGQRAVDAQTVRGLVLAARAQANTYVAHTRVEGASFVARTGMARVAELSADEAHYSAQAPMAEPRYRAIADAFASLVVGEVIKLGYNL